MKVMVMTNEATNLDIANGSHGEIIGITPDPREEQRPNHGTVVLSYPPTYILVKLQRTRAEKLEGLEDGTLPIEPAKKNIKIQVPVVGKKNMNRNVKQVQLPLTAAYTFTDYQSQGQTIPHLIVNIATPPTGGKLTLFTLSQSSGQDTIRVLCEFDEEIFMQELDMYLGLEDQRLRELNDKTKDLVDVNE
ncbi:hypothetical protein K439DRAFT_1618710 [Ramaria rubella]|nr:hypothetical protein K439DRAFT_1618710 [Ramaria rubella]